MKPTLEKLREARRIAAEIVACCGEQYWPIFEYIDEEIVRLEARASRLQACLVQQDAKAGHSKLASHLPDA